MLIKKEEEESSTLLLSYTTSHLHSERSENFSKKCASCKAAPVFSIRICSIIRGKWTKY
jgi:hypothetical protein